MPIEHRVPPAAPQNGAQAPVAAATQATVAAPTAAATVAQASVAPPVATVNSTLQADLLDEAAIKKKKEDMKKMIGKIIKDHVFRQTKFIRFEGADEVAAAKVVEHCNYTQLCHGTDAEKNSFKALWISNYKGLVASCLNTRRGECTQQLRKLFKSKFNGPDRQLPPPAALESILKRSFAPNHAPMMELFSWWWDEVIPKVAGKDWDDDKRYYGLMSNHHYPNQRDMLYVPVSTEALAVWIVENNRKCWPLIWAKEEEFARNGIKGPKGQALIVQKVVNKPDKTPYEPGEEVVSWHCLGLILLSIGPDYRFFPYDFSTQVEAKGAYLKFCGPKYQGIYTVSNSGQSKTSGINQAGSTKFDQLCDMATKGRGMANLTLCRDLELRTLHQLRDNAKITAKSQVEEDKKKRRKVQVVPQKADMGHDDFAEDTVAVDDNFVLDLTNLAASFAPVPPALAPVPPLDAIVQPQLADESKQGDEDDG